MPKSSRSIHQIKMDGSSSAGGSVVCDLCTPSETHLEDNYTVSGLSVDFDTLQSFAGDRLVWSLLVVDGSTTTTTRFVSQNLESKSRELEYTARFLVRTFDAFNESLLLLVPHRFDDVNIVKGGSLITFFQTFTNIMDIAVGHSSKQPGE